MIAAIALVFATITGVVRDSSGGAVADASVIVRVASEPAGAEQRTATGPDGRFTIALPAGGELVIIVRANGFAEVERHVSSSSAGPGGSGGLEIVLAPAALF